MPLCRQLVLAAVVLGACTETSQKDQQPPDSGPPPETTGAGIAQGQVDEGACALVPEPRMNAQATSFVAKVPFALDGDAWTVDRGVLLYGGQGAGAVVLNDLWLLDLTNPDRACPWILLHGDAVPGGGTYGGGLVYRPSAATGGPGEFVLATGYVESAGDIVSEGALYRMPEDLLSLGFEPLRDGDGPRVGFVRSDDGICQSHDGPYFWCRCIDDTADTGACPVDYWDVDVTFDPCAGPGTLTFPSGHCPDEQGLDPACPDGPYCNGELGTYYATAPGVAAMGVVYDPIHDALELHGGAIGCTGSGCRTRDGWRELFEAANAEDAVPSQGSSSYLVGADWVQTYTFANGYTSFSYPNLAPFTPGTWPDEATIGIGVLSGAMVGAQWDPTTRTLAAGDSPMSVVVGGTTSRLLPPETSHQITESSLTSIEDMLSADAAEWVQVWPTVDWPFDADVQPADTVRRWLGEGLGYERQPVDVPLPSDPTTLAVAAVEPDALLVAGAGSTLTILDYDAGFTSIDRYDLTVPVDSRVAPSVVADPVTRTAYVLGGSYQARDVDTIAANGAAITANQHSAFVTLDNEVTFHVIDSGATSTDWVVDTTVGTKILHRCEAPIHAAYPRAFGTSSADADDSTLSTDCFADRIDLELLGAKIDSGAVVGLTADVRRDADEPWRPLDVSTLDLTGATPTVPLMLRRTLLDGDTFELRVSFRQSLGVTATTLAAVASSAGGWQQTPVGPTASSQWLSVTGVPARVRMTTDAWSTFAGGPAKPEALQELTSVSTVRVRHPSVYVAAAAGTVESCSTAPFAILDPTDSPDADELLTCVTSTDRTQVGFWQVSLLKSFERTAVTVDGRSFQVFVDSGLAARLRGPAGAIVSHWTGGLNGDLAEVTSRIGTFPVDQFPVVYMRDPECGASNVVGMSMYGYLVTVVDFDCVTGDVPSGDDGDWKLTGLHELVHTYAGITTIEAAEDTSWILEAIPENLSIRRYPTAPSTRDELAIALDFAVGLTNTTSPSFSVEDPADLANVEIEYGFGPYLIEQLAFAARAGGSTDALVWDELERLFTNAATRADTRSAEFPGPLDGNERLWIPEIEVADVRPMADMFALGTSWYDQLVSNARTTTGFPLIGWHSYVPPTAVGTTASITVRQAQQDLYGWSLYADVPYLIGCSSATNLTLPSYTQCGATKLARTTGPIKSIAAVEDQAITLNLIAGRSRDVHMAILANDMLLNNGIPTYGLTHHDPWMLRCRPGSGRPECLVDGDGDGFPTVGDCDDSNIAVNPGINTFDPAVAGYVPEAALDLNCDTWPR
ncbi:MAG: hypothetical protein ABMB14_08650 [Myxococcota bacterium]